jgi:nitrite reductase (NADH) large subunit
MSEPLVVVGSGLAATRLVDELTRVAANRYELALIGSEPRAPYNRVLLSSLLAGEVESDALGLKPGAWWADNGITTHFGKAVVSIDRRDQRVTLADGSSLRYSKLVLATGSSPIRLSKPGMCLPGVFTFRDFADVDALKNAAQAGSRAVVIGGGLLGIEAAYGLARSGVRARLVHLVDRLMERQLDARSGALLRQAIEAAGIEVLLEADTARIVGTDRASGVELADGRMLEADFVVCAVGIRPQARLARDAGLVVERGIVVDDRLTTSDSRISAIGECVEHRGIVYGLVEPAYEQAKVLARALAGDTSARYIGSAIATKLKVSGVNVFSAGEFEDGPASEIITLEDEGEGTYRKLVVRDGRLVGAVLVGDTADAPWYLDLLRSGAEISHMRDVLAFGPALANAA